ncbi:MAG: DUF2478 domain-containing protein [Phycisphaerae bacterium]|nr:DUF2478 domain-containing protein [Phycisphaerae bacterium]
MRILLWTGAKHSGKTTRAAELLGQLQDVGVTCAGLLAKSRYDNCDKKLCGFGAVDITTSAHATLLERVEAGRSGDVGNFVFCDEGLQLGQAALQKAIDGKYDFVLVDEFGPLELSGAGWRAQVDVLAKLDGVLMLVVRDDLVEQVAGLYGVAAGDVLSAEEDSMAYVLEVCKNLATRGKF